MNPEEVAEWLTARGEWSSSRSSGPGGQRRDHAETRVQLTIRPEALAGLPEPLATRLTRRLGLDERPLRLRAGTERRREDNRRLVEARLRARVAAALEPPSPPRRPTRPTAASAKRHVEAKRRRSVVKRTRRTPAGDD